MPKGTKSGRKTAAADVEEKLEAGARKRGLTGRRADAYEFGTLNKIGLKRGSKTTAKGMRPAKRKR